MIVLHYTRVLLIVNEKEQVDAICLAPQSKT